MTTSSKSTIVVVAISVVLLVATLLTAPAQEMGVIQLGGRTVRALLETLADDISQGRVFLETVPVIADPDDAGDFGAAIAVQGNTAIIGAPQADGSKGAAFIFTRSNGKWTRQQKLVPADRSQVLQFGTSVALDGDIAVVGATGGKNDSNPGSAFIFTRDGGSWSEAHKLAAYDGAPGDGFGTAVALNQGRAIIGAIHAAVENRPSQGAAYIFSYFNGAWSLQEKLTANDGTASDDFGIAVDLDGDTAVVGAGSAEIGGEAEQGAVYTYSHDGRWRQRSKIIAFDGEVGDHFGAALALDSNSILIGAWNKHVVPNPGQGAAYVYTGSDGTWNLQQKLTVNDGQEGDRFGIAVALHDDTALIGATGRDFTSYLTVEEDRGAVYVFARSGDLWRRGQELIAHDGQEDDLFGSSVALDRDTAVIGAIRAIDSSVGYAGKFYAADRGPQPWPLVDRVRDSDENGCPGFGYDVGLDDNRAVVSRTDWYGDEAAVYFYELENGAWVEKQTFDVEGGAASIALQGDVAVIGAPRADAAPNKTLTGAVYVFVYEGGAWKQQQKLEATDSAEYDRFGTAVALDGAPSGDSGTIMVGADGHGDRGAVYVYERSGATWAFQQKVTPGGAQSWAGFGEAVDLDGETAVVGAPGNFGAAYILHYDGAAWKERQKLVASDAIDFGHFGISVAIDGDTAVIGASRQEAAYIFTWDGVEWQERQKLTASDNPGYSAMGRSVDLDGDTAVVGAVKADIGSSINQGAAYIYRRGESKWEQTQKLIPPNGPQPAVFGYPALDEDTVLVGAPGNDYHCNGIRRFAYFFEGEKLTQFIIFPIPSAGQVGDSVLLTAAASSGLPVSYVSETPGKCSVSGGTAVLLANGKCRIKASQLGNETYNPAEDVVLSFSVGAGAYQVYLPTLTGLPETAD